MVVLRSSHPASIDPKTRLKLARRTLKEGVLADYILDRQYTLNDKVWWLERKGRVIAWCVKSHQSPMWESAFMVYVTKKNRRQGWASFLYQEAMKHSVIHYNVYGYHSAAAQRFYEKQGREDWV